MLNQLFKKEINLEQPFLLTKRAFPGKSNEGLRKKIKEILTNKAKRFNFDQAEMPLTQLISTIGFSNSELAKQQLQEIENSYLACLHLALGISTPCTKDARYSVTDIEQEGDYSGHAIGKLWIRDNAVKNYNFTYYSVGTVQARWYAENVHTFNGQELIEQLEA